MRKIYKIITFLLIIICLFILNINTSIKVNGQQNRNKTIYIDPGHGGIDGGATNDDVIEKKLNLNVALYLKGYFELVGINVLMTRESDLDFYGDISGSKKKSDLQTRVDMINNSDADLFISIHMNSLADRRWSGSQVFYYPSEKNEILAKTIMKNLRDILKNTTREAKTINTLYILKRVDKPGVLVEAGFLSNPTELKLLNDSNYQQKLAYAIFIGVLNYLDE